MRFQDSLLHHLANKERSNDMRQQHSSLADGGDFEDGHGRLQRRRRRDIVSSPRPCSGHDVPPMAAAAATAADAGLIVASRNTLVVFARHLPGLPRILPRLGAHSAPALPLGPGWACRRRRRQLAPAPLASGRDLRGRNLKNV